MSVCLPFLAWATARLRRTHPSCARRGLVIMDGDLLLFLEAHRRAVQRLAEMAGAAYSGSLVASWRADISPRLLPLIRRITKPNVEHFLELLDSDLQLGAFTMHECLGRHRQRARLAWTRPHGASRVGPRRRVRTAVCAAAAQRARSLAARRPVLQEAGATMSLKLVSLAQGDGT